MAPIISLLVILTLSILITRIATVALVVTGLSREAARFQARSAYTGVGFTTSESEKVVNHPVRRKILLVLMLLGNAGIITTISSLILTFINLGSSKSFALRIGLLIAGLAVLWAVGTSHWIDARLSRVINWALQRYTKLEIQDIISLLNLSGEYRVSEQPVKANGWLSDKSLGDLRLREEGILVLGITRADGTYVGAPKGATKILPNDNLVLYGRSSALEDLDHRLKGSRGDRAHDAACFEQKRVLKEEREGDPAERAQS